MALSAKNSVKDSVMEGSIVGSVMRDAFSLQEGEWRVEFAKSIDSDTGEWSENVWMPICAPSPSRGRVA